MKSLIKIIIISSWILIVNILSPAHSQQDQCFVCHESIGDNVAILFKKDIHYQKNISCSACHGGDNKSEDMEEAMNPKKGYSGIPKGDQISSVCISCHSNSEKMKKYGSNLPTNQIEQIQNSIHWQKSIKGTEHIVQCSTCHNAHGIVSVKNPLSPVYSLNLPKTCSKCHSNAVYMRSYNPSLPVDQFQKYKTSVHGIRNINGDIMAADCSDCHGSHEIRIATDIKSKVYPTNIPETCSVCHSNSNYMKGYKIATDQYSKFASSVHGIALLEKNDLNAPTCNSCHGNHAATPPGVESISKVCGTCHALNSDLFSGSPHKQVFDQKKYPECETCHKYHDIVTASNELLGVSKDAVCSKCHSESENTKGFAIAKKMRNFIDSLESEINSANELINEAEQKGMEISDAKFKLRDANQAKLESRTMVHSFDFDKFKEIVSNKGLKTTSQIKEEARNSIDNFFFRRYGLVASVIIMTMLAFALYLYIKQIEKRQKTN